MKSVQFSYVKLFPFLSILFTVYVYLFNACSLHVCQAVAWEVEVGARRLAFILVVDIPSVLIKSKLKDSACFSNVSFSTIILITSIRYTTLKLLQFTLLFMCHYPPSSKKKLDFCCICAAWGDVGGRPSPGTGNTWTAWMPRMGASQSSGFIQSTTRTGGSQMISENIVNTLNNKRVNAFIWQVINLILVWFFRKVFLGPIDEHRSTTMRGLH